MLSRMHNKLGTAGLLVAVVALVAALTGAAFAAGGLTKQQEKQVKKIAKKYAGKRGAKGAPGATGAAGPAGPVGPAGKNGTNGTNGADGTNGTNGESVNLGTATSGECPSGGVTVQVGSKSATKKSVCNGVTGFTETLPSGKTETGNWEVESGGLVALSFNIPLAQAPEAVHFLKEGEGETTDCPGTAAEPEAKPGNLCLYTLIGEAVFTAEFNTNVPGTINKEGAIVQFVSGQALGTWAVTAK
jgi:hypothetical protein